MRHAIAHRKLNRTSNQRKALFSGLIINLVEREKILTTLPKAKEVRPLVEKLITKGKTKIPLVAYQQIYKVLRHKEATQKIISILATRFQHRAGGYLSIKKAGYRYGDQAPMALIEFVEKGEQSIAQ